LQYQRRTTCSLQHQKAMKNDMQLATPKSNGIYR